MRTGARIVRLAIISLLLNTRSISERLYVEQYFRYSQHTMNWKSLSSVFGVKVNLDQSLGKYLGNYFFVDERVVEHAKNPLC